MNQISSPARHIARCGKFTLKIIFPLNLIYDSIQNTHVTNMANKAWQSLTIEKVNINH